MHPIQAQAAAVGKILELPEAKYLCIKKTGKLKTFFQDAFTQACTSHNEGVKSVICFLLLSITQQHYTLSLYQKVLSAYQDTVV